jgi:hypothetical protein
MGLYENQEQGEITEDRLAPEKKSSWQKMNGYQEKVCEERREMEQNETVFD